MVRTTAEPSVDVERLFPGLGAYARTAVRLHPRPGKPGVRDSHIGGPLLWPVGEPWPGCDRTVRVQSAPTWQPGWLRMRDRVPERPLPMVGVAQFYARDLPEIPFPDDTDLLQVLWCPNEHADDLGSTTPPLLVWRRTADVTDALADPPMRDHTTPNALFDTPEADLSQELYLPRPCVLHPERITEYPGLGELPDPLRAAVTAWDAETYADELSFAPGCKLAGWELWHAFDKIDLPCEVCGTETVPLLKLDSSEGAGTSRWRPLEERHLEPGTPEYDDAQEPTTLQLGRYGALTLFLCPRSARHGYRMTLQ